MAANVAFMYCCRRQTVAINNVRNNPIQGFDLTDPRLFLFFDLNTLEKIALLYGRAHPKIKVKVDVKVLKPFRSDRVLVFSRYFIKKKDMALLFVLYFL